MNFPFWHFARTWVNSYAGAAPLHCVRHSISRPLRPFLTQVVDHVQMQNPSYRRVPLYCCLTTPGASSCDGTKVGNRTHLWRAGLCDGSVTMSHQLPQQTTPADRFTRLTSKESTWVPCLHAKGSAFAKPIANAQQGEGRRPRPKEPLSGSSSARADLTGE